MCKSSKYPHKITIFASKSKNHYYSSTEKIVLLLKL